MDNIIVESLVLLIFLLILVPSLVAYKRAMKRLWFAHAWSCHSLILGCLLLILDIFGLHSAVLMLTAGTMLVVTGLGMALLLCVYYIDNGRMMSKTLIEETEIFVSHLFMFIVGLVFVLIARPGLLSLFSTVAFLLFYFLLMFDRFQVPWIVYEKSKIPAKMRENALRALLIILYILTPLLGYFVR